MKVFHNVALHPTKLLHQHFQSLMIFISGIFFTALATFLLLNPPPPPFILLPSALRPQPYPSPSPAYHYFAHLGKIGASPQSFSIIYSKNFVQMARELFCRWYKRRRKLCSAKLQAGRRASSPLIECVSQER